MQTEHIVQSLKASVFATGLSLVFALIFAVIVRFCSVTETTQLVVAQSLKAISLAAGCLGCIKTDGGWKKGLLAGIVFTLLTYFSFSAIGGGLSWSWKWLLDVALGVAIGSLSGIAAVNLKRSS